MTARDSINGRKRKAAIISYIGWAVFVVGLFLTIQKDSMWPLCALGGAVLAGGTLYMLYGLRCPHCQKRLGLIIGPSGSPFSMRRDVRFCPLCGVAFDTQLDETQKV